MQTKFWMAALLGFVLVTVSACGGSGKSSVVIDLEEKLQAEQEAREEAEKTAAEEVEKRKEEVEKRKEEEEARRKAEARIEQERQKAEQAAEDEREAKAAQQEAEQQQEQLQEQLTEAQQAELSARAATYIAAINGGGAARSGVTVTYQRGSTLKINPGGNFEAGSGAPAIPGFTPRTYTRSVGVSGEQTLYLYTNIQAPGTRAFWKLYGLEVTGAQANAAQNPTPTGSPEFITDSSDNATATGVRVGGTYHGVSGTYTCDTGSCVGAKSGITLGDFVEVSDGQRSFASGSTWDFKPGSLSSGVRQDEDTEHLYFGIWAQEPELASGTHSYQYITGGSAAFMAVDTLSGIARFSGGAVGKYVTRNQVGENAKFGTFTAAVSLTADFDADTLEGRITRFRDGSEELANWNVYLGASATAPVAGFAGSVTDAHVEASIGGVQATGTWDATLYGTPNPGRTELASAADAATKYPLARYPAADLAGIVGNFHATDDATAADANVAIAGAFGATPSN